MRRRLTVIATVVLMVVAFATPASAITNGRPDGDDHPYVGLVVSFDEQDNVKVCSGSLIASNVVLTAGHCVDGMDISFVLFKKKVPLGNLEGAVPGTPYTHPKYLKSPYEGSGLPAVQHRDIGVVVLFGPAGVSKKANLPSAGLVNRLKNKREIDVVGYGVTEQAKVPGSKLRGVGPYPPPYYRWTGALTRMQARAELVSGKFRHSAGVLRLSRNPSQGKGGSCFGDSGGPDLLGGTDKVLAVVSYGTNINCKGVGYSSRVDVPEVLNWIKGFMP